MRSTTDVTFGGRYDSRPNPNLPARMRSENIGRSGITNSYQGTNSKLDSDIIDKKQDRYPKVRRLADEISDIEISKSGLKRQVFMPKPYQTIHTYLDLSNRNSRFDQNNDNYIYDINNPRYYKSSFGKSGLEKINKLVFYPLSLPTYFETVLGFDLSRIYLNFNITEDVGNENFNYVVSFYPDNNASTPTRKILLPVIKEFDLNGYCPLNTISMQIRDIAGPISIQYTEFIFTLVGIGLVTTFELTNHGLTTNMRVYLPDCSQKKTIFPRSYPITVIDDDQFSINVDTSSMLYLLGQSFSMIVDDFVFNTAIKIESIREDV
jgi:hypothetical protein